MVLPLDSEPDPSRSETTEPRQEESGWSKDQFEQFVTNVWYEAEPKLNQLLQRAGADAQDLANEGVERFLQKGRELFSPTTEVRSGAAYLITICANLAIDRHRRLQRITWLSLDRGKLDEERKEMGWQAHPNHIETGVDDGFERGVLNRDLCIQILAHLKEDDRQLLISRHMCDMTMEEIANQLGKSLGCVYTRLHRAEKRAYKVLQKMDHTLTRH